jgi:serine/threonine-protein kinase HipA
LIAPGSSIGGARPKASVSDPQGHLWIAKFPSAKDDKNIGAWEMVVNTMASRAGLNVAESTIKTFKNKFNTYLSKRFDRTENGDRIHFASAMTLLGYKDGAGQDTGVSYLEMAEFIMKHGAVVNTDLEELWRRIVFHICVKNTDDHLRNHGFLLTDKGWRLSPAYDINPNEFGTGLSLNISEKENTLDIELALSVATFFRIDSKKANQIINQIKKVVINWRQFAKDCGIGKSEQDRMSNAFESF